jgi:hypothetical protein
MTRKQKKEMMSFFKEMDARIEAKEKKQQKLAEINPEFPTKKTIESKKRIAAEVF